MTIQTRPHLADFARRVRLNQNGQNPTFDSVAALDQLSRKAPEDTRPTLIIGEVSVRALKPDMDEQKAEAALQAALQAAGFEMTQIKIRTWFTAPERA